MSTLASMRFIAISFFAVLTVALSSCSKKIAPTITGTVPATTYNIQEVDFEYFEGKARVNFKDNKKERDVKAAIRIRKDSVIWMNFSVLGVQGGRVLINKDSITLLSNIDKEYFVFDYKELSKRFNFHIDYDVVQAAMLGNLVQAKSDKDKVTQEPSFTILDQDYSGVHIKNYINSATTKLERVEMTESNSNNSMTINYRNFQQVNDKLFPYNGVISLFYKAAAGVLNNTIEFEYNKAEVGDKELKFPFSIPRKYDRR